MRHVKEVSVSVNQFAYRANTSTVLANALLKEAIYSNINSDSPVYSCFIDLSRAFEMVDHSILIDELVDKNVPHYVVNIFRALFKYSNAQVFFNGSFSDKWNI